MASTHTAAMSSTAWPPSPPRSPARSVSPARASSSSAETKSSEPVITTTATTTTIITPPPLAAKAQQQQQRQQQQQQQQYGQAPQFPLSPEISPLLAATRVSSSAAEQQIHKELLLQLQQQAAQIQLQQHQIPQQNTAPVIISIPQPPPVATLAAPNRQSISSTSSSTSSSTVSSAASSSLSVPLTISSATTTSTGPQQQAVSPAHRMSVQSISKMPPIHEDADSIFTDVGPASRRRSTRSGGFYQYGEDYITTYDGLGGLPSPQPPQRPGSVVSMRSMRSVSPGSESEGGSGGYVSHPGLGSDSRRASARLSVGGGMSRKGSHQGSNFANITTGGMGSVSEEGKAIMERGIDAAGSSNDASTAAASAAMTERAGTSSLGGTSDLEKGFEDRSLDGEGQSRGWRRWRRLIVLLLVILAVAGFAVGLAFGIHH
ncbi:hypothetical protein BD289DRAFT_158946 [Coniella lustricola]|uniref:Uncharacterized protein n=1 Tax=Coniella lustricola TaxID=2025994 RepID=A0A2T3AEH5_9PEZI|nr:hypothetical protein BD289DRAFT_158946 [Coniella lustricola]